MALEDCVLSRQIVSHPHSGPQGFLAEFADGLWAPGEHSGALHASGLPARVRAEAVRRSPSRWWTSPTTAP